MTKLTLYRSLTIEKRRKISKVLDGIDVNLKKQLDAFDKNLLATIREERNCIKLVKSNQMSIEQFQDRANKLNEWRRKFLTGGKDIWESTMNTE